MSNINLNIPSHWKTALLGDFVKKQKGKKPKHLSTKKSDKFFLPYVDIKVFEKGIIGKFTDGEGCVICEENDFLIVWDGSRSGLVGKAIKGALGSTLVRINFPGVFNDYAFYFLRSKYLEINTRAKGSGTPHVDPDLLWNYDFPLPPLPEQHRIVTKIEELFSELDNGIASLKKAKEQLKVYRQSVLKWAFEGNLTNDNLKAGELPNGWKWALLLEVTSVITDGDHQPPPKSPSGIPFITISNVNKRDNKIDFLDTFFVSEDYYNSLKQHRKPIKGDILYTVTGSFGIPILIDFEKKFCFQRHIGLVRPLASTYQKWLYYLLQSPQVYSQAEKTATGTAQKTVALKALRNFLIPLSPIDEQNQIVLEIESRLSLADKLEKTIDQSLQQAEALRQSILKTAFEGKLVPQDTNDEPAEVLLERIKK